MSTQSKADQSTVRGTLDGSHVTFDLPDIELPPPALSWLDELRATLDHTPDCLGLGVSGYCCEAEADYWRSQYPAQVLRTFTPLDRDAVDRAANVEAGSQVAILVMVAAILTVAAAAISAVLSR